MQWYLRMRCVPEFSTASWPRLGSSTGLLATPRLSFEIRWMVAGAS